jgi:hypothetical protein
MMVHWFVQNVATGFMKTTVGNTLAKHVQLELILVNLVIMTKHNAQLALRGDMVIPQLYLLLLFARHVLRASFLQLPALLISLCALIVSLAGIAVPLD